MPLSPKAKVSFHVADKQSHVCKFEEAAPNTLVDLQHLVWQRADAWRHGGILPHELQVFQLQWSHGGLEKVSRKVGDQIEYEAVLRQSGSWCEFKVVADTAGAKWNWLWDTSLDMAGILKDYQERANILSEFAGLDQEDLQWMHDLPSRTGAVLEVVVGGRANSGKSLLISALLGRPDFLPSSKFSFTPNDFVVLYGKEVQTELRRRTELCPGNLYGRTIRTWPRQINSKDLLVLHPLHPTTEDCVEQAASHVGEDSVSQDQEVHQFCGEANIRSCGNDTIVCILPHPLLQAGLRLREWSSSCDARDVDQGLLWPLNDKDDASARVLIWCIDIHGTLDSEFKHLLRVSKQFPCTLVVLTQCGEAVGAEVMLEKGLIKEASRIAKECIQGLSDDDVLPVSARQALENVAKGIKPPAAWTRLVEHLMTMAFNQLRGRLNNSWSVDVRSLMEERCVGKQCRIQNGALERLSPMVGIKSALSTAWSSLRTHIHDRFSSTQASRRAALVDVKHNEDTSITDPSVAWYSVHRDVYVQEVRRIIEGDAEFVAMISELISRGLCDLNSRLAQASTELKQNGAPEDIICNEIATDASAFMVAVDILYSSSFMNVNQRSWPAFLRCQSGVLTEVAMSFMSGTVSESDKLTNSASNKGAPHEKDWLFDRFEAEALAAVDEGLQSRKLAALKSAEAQYNKSLQGYLDAQFRKRHILAERYNALATMKVPIHMTCI